MRYGLISKLALTGALMCVFGTSAYMSVYGLWAFLANHQVVAIFFGSGLETGKLMMTFHTHRQWDGMQWLTRIFRCGVIGALVVFTSFEVTGFLWLSHNVSTEEYQLLENSYVALEKEAAGIRAELKTLDDTISNWPETWVTKRLEARQSIGYDKKRERLQEINRDQTRLKTKKSIEYSGPVFAAARILKWPPDKIAKWFVFYMVLIAECLSIGLAVAVSMAWKKEASGERREARGRAEKQENNKNRKIENNTNAQELDHPDKPGDDTPIPLQVTAQKQYKEHPSVVYLKQIQAAHGLTVEQIADITERRKLATVEKWLSGIPVPEKSMRLITQWVNGKGGSIATHG